MSIVSVVNHLVFPTENDIHGGSSGAGRIGQETSLAALWKGIDCTNGVVSGFSPIPTGAGFTKSIPSGIAVIDGYVVKGSTSESFTFTASQTVNLFLRLNFTSSKVTSVTLEDYTGSTIPANSVLLAQVVTDGSGVTSQTDRRPQNKRIYGRINSNGTINDTGSGYWTSTSPGAGSYTITVTSGYFLRAPMVVAMCTTTNKTMAGSASSATSISLASNDGTDQAFYFEAFL